MRKFEGVVYCGSIPVSGASLEITEQGISGKVVRGTGTNIDGEFVMLRVPTIMVCAVLKVSAPNCGTMECDASDLPKGKVRIDLRAAFEEA